MENSSVLDPAPTPKMAPTERVALITGASRGLGYTLAEFLARQQWTLILNARHENALGTAAERLRAAGAVVTAVPGDVVRPRDRRAIAAAARRAGRLDLLVNNASELGPSPLPPLLEHPLPALRRVFEVNVLAPIALVRACLPLLRSSRGLVVNVTSDAARGGYPGWGGYGSSQGALELVSKTLANESATLAASLEAHGPAGTYTLDLSTRYADGLWVAEPRWDPAHPGPMPIQSGEEARVGDATVRYLAPYPGIPRLWFIRSDRPLEPILAEAGVPIHYGYVRKIWPLDAYQSMFSRVPGSAEMPSAARPITPSIEKALQAAGVRFTSVVLHSGVSSLEIETDSVEQQAVYPEPFQVSRSAAEMVNRTREEGHRVVAIGTTVVRALESAWTPDGLRPRQGFTRLFVHPGNPVRSVDGLLTGFHDPVTSHLAMLAALIGLPRVMAAYREAIANGYRWHEFGDSHLILRK